MKPIVAWVWAPHQSSGTGGTTCAASSFLTSRLPTCGPLPWVSTTSTPEATRSATGSHRDGDRRDLGVRGGAAVGAGHGVAAEGDAGLARRDLRARRAGRGARIDQEPARTGVVRTCPAPCRLAARARRTSSASRRARRARRARCRCARRGVGGCEVLAAAAREGVVVEADRRARDLDPAEHRVVDVDDEALAAGLLPVVDAVEGAHLARGDAELGQPGQQGRRAGCRRTPRRASR